jgi:mono/diheme cytochrome c family protein
MTPTKSHAHPPSRWVWPVVVFGLAQPVYQASAAATEAWAARLYLNHCSVCHGEKGDGNSRASGALSTAPRDFTSEASKRELTRERIVQAITQGRPGTSMVGWKTQLSASDIDALAAHVLTEFVQRNQGAAHTAAATEISGRRSPAGADGGAVGNAGRPDMKAGMPKGLQGNVKRGRDFYAANCVSCHGARGDGAGPRAYFISPKPRNFVDPASRALYSRAALYFAVSEGRLGSEMPAWKQVATPQQIADVAEYVFQTFLQATAPGEVSKDVGTIKR